MDKAPDFGSGDCRFESCHGREISFCSKSHLLFMAPKNNIFVIIFLKSKYKCASKASCCYSIHGEVNVLWTLKSIGGLWCKKKQNTMIIHLLSRYLFSIVLWSANKCVCIYDSNGCCYFQRLTYTHSRRETRFSPNNFTDCSSNCLFVYLEYTVRKCFFFFSINWKLALKMTVISSANPWKIGSQKYSDCHLPDFLWTILFEMTGKNQQLLKPLLLTRWNKCLTVIPNKQAHTTHIYLAWREGVSNLLWSRKHRV